MNSISNQIIYELNFELLRTLLRLTSYDLWLDHSSKLQHFNKNSGIMNFNFTVHQNLYQVHYKYQNLYQIPQFSTINQNSVQSHNPKFSK